MNYYIVIKETSEIIKYDNFEKWNSNKKHYWVVKEMDNIAVCSRNGFRNLDVEDIDW